MQTNFNKLPYRSNVGIMMVNEKGYVFVGQRLDNNQNAWQMPQGGIDAGEDPETAAYRELRRNRCKKTKRTICGVFVSVAVVRFARRFNTNPMER